MTGGRPAGVVLAAGEGTRLRPLTSLRPKALCPVGNVPLVDLAVHRVAAVTGAGPEHVAVNAHRGADAVLAHLGRRATVSREHPQALGTAGALGALRDWIDGRDVLVTNADLYLPAGLGRFAEGWDGRRSRLLCRPVTGRGDFPLPPGRGATAPDPPDGAAGRHEAPPGPGEGAGSAPEAPVGSPGGLRYVGVCLLPWTTVARLAPTPSGLYEVLWREQAAREELDLVTLLEVGAGEVAVDCGTPRDYLMANLHAGGGRSVVGAGAQVEGTLQRCVVWDGAWVDPQEHLVEVIRAGTRRDPVTVAAGPVPLTPRAVDR